MQSVNGHFENNCRLYGAPWALAATTASLSILLGLLNIFGNILIILAVVLDPNKNLRSPFNWLIVNLALADLIVGIFTEPVSAAIHLNEALGKKYSDAEVKVLHMSYFISCTASALSIASLAIERYFAVRKPNTYRASVTNKRIVLTVTGIWFIAFGLPNIYFEVGYILYSLIFANASLAIAVSITCFTYTLARRKIKKRSEEMSYNVIKASPASTTAMNNENILTNPLLNSALEMEAKVTQMFLVVLVAMFCCYGPATVFIYLMNFCESCSCLAQHWFRDLQFIFTLMNSSLNLCCYAMQSSRFRSAVAKILKIMKRSRHSKHTYPDTMSSTLNSTTRNTSRKPADVQRYGMVKLQVE